MKKVISLDYSVVDPSMIMSLPIEVLYAVDEKSPKIKTLRAFPPYYDTKVGRMKIEFVDIASGAVHYIVEYTYTKVYSEPTAKFVDYLGESLISKIVAMEGPLFHFTLTFSNALWKT